MDISSILTIAIPTIATTIVGIILKKQINSQNQIIQNYKDYIQTTDWKKVKEQYETFTIPELENLHITDKLNTLRNIYIERKKYDDRVKQEFEELLATCVFCLKQLDKEQAKKIVETLKFGKSDIQALLDETS